MASFWHLRVNLADLYKNTEDQLSPEQTVFIWLRPHRKHDNHKQQVSSGKSQRLMNYSSFLVFPCLSISSCSVFPAFPVLVCLLSQIVFQHWNRFLQCSSLLQCFFSCMGSCSLQLILSLGFLWRQVFPCYFRLHGNPTQSHTHKKEHSSWIELKGMHPHLKLFHHCWMSSFQFFFLLGSQNYAIMRHHESCIVFTAWFTIVCRKCSVRGLSSTCPNNRWQIIMFVDVRSHTHFVSCGLLLTVRKAWKTYVTVRPRQCHSLCSLRWIPFQ